MGQTWYPTFIPEMFPGVANFNTGILFNPFGWATQIRLKHNFTKELSFAITAYIEREFSAVTATGQLQNSASINSLIPTHHGQFQFRNQNWLVGLGAEYKRLQPLTEYAPTPTTKAVTNEKVTSSSFVGFFKYSNDDVSIKVYGITGSNMTNLVMIGGYAGYTKPGQSEKYVASKASSFWVDIASNNKKIAPGIFAGYTSNDGTSKNGLASNETVKYYMRGVSGKRVVDNVWRASGRIDFKQNKFRVTPEIEYTAAAWGDLNSNGNGSADKNSVNVANVRLLASCAYSF
jgi:hypothetical protein